MLRILAFLAFPAAAVPVHWIAVPPGSYFQYEGGRAVERAEPSLPAVFEMPNAGTGYVASCSYGDSFPWFVNAGGADLTGTRPYRNPSVGAVSRRLSGVVGLEFTGSFEGRAAGAGADYAWEVVFFHEQKCYAGGSEFGFRRDAVRGGFQFYWSINSNCALDDTRQNPPALSVCRASRGGGAHVQESTGAINLHYSPGPNRYRVTVAADPKDGKKKFLVEILEPYDSPKPWRTFVDPNAPGFWFTAPADPNARFPIETLERSHGYVTVGIQRSAGTTLRFDQQSVPAVRVRSLRVALSQ